MRRACWCAAAKSGGRGCWKTASPARGRLRLPLALSAEKTGALARLTLTQGAGAAGELSLPDFFDALVARRALEQSVGCGLRLTLTWT